MNFTKTQERLKEWIAVYLGAVSCILVPLYIKGNYFGLIELKARTYLRAAIPAVVLMAVLVPLGLIWNRKSAQIETKRQRKNAGEVAKSGSFSAEGRIFPFVLLALIGIWALAASLLSSNPRVSFWGSAGWSVGSLMNLVLIAETMIVSVYFRFNPYLLLPVMAANMFINILAVVQSAGINAFGLQNGLIEEQYYTYMTTIGNANSYSGYLCLVMPLFWGAFLSCKDRLTEVLYGVFAALGFMGIIMANSDSNYAGIAICLLFMLPFVFESEKYLKRSGILVVIYSCCLLFSRYFPMFADKTWLFGKLSWALLGRPVAELCFAGGVLLYLAGGKLIRSGKGKYVMIAAELLIVSVICYFVRDTVLHFNDEWGSGRGGIWRSAWEYFRDLPVSKKITGIGPEMIYEAYSVLKAETGRNVVTAHCEPLQILLAQGIVGLGLYIVFWVYLVMLFFKKKLWKTNTAVFFFPLAAYWGQSIFCSVYPITAVMFGFMTGLYLNSAVFEELRR